MSITPKSDGNVTGFQRAPRTTPLLCAPVTPRKGNSKKYAEKLHEMITHCHRMWCDEDPRKQIARWNEDGTAFIFEESEGFREKLKEFDICESRDIKSAVRNMNAYGFKVQQYEGRGGKVARMARHQSFSRGSTKMLRDIKRGRKTNLHKDEPVEVEKKGKKDVNTTQKQLDEMKQEMKDMNSKLDAIMGEQRNLMKMLQTLCPKSLEINESLLNSQGNTPSQVGSKPRFETTDGAGTTSPFQKIPRTSTDTAEDTEHMAGQKHGRTLLYLLDSDSMPGNGVLSTNLPHKADQILSGQKKAFALADYLPSCAASDSLVSVEVQEGKGNLSASLSDPPKNLENKPPQLPEQTPKRPDQNDMEECFDSMRSAKQKHSESESNPLSELPTDHRTENVEDLFEFLEFFVPKELDVVCLETNCNLCYRPFLAKEESCYSGNIKYEGKISARRRDYSRSNENERDEIVNSIIDWVLEHKGRFLNASKWYDEIHDKQPIKDMTRRALQTRSVAERRPERNLKRGMQQNESGECLLDCGHGSCSTKNTCCTRNFSRDSKKWYGPRFSTDMSEEAEHFIGQKRGRSPPGHNRSESIPNEEALDAGFSRKSANVSRWNNEVASTSQKPALSASSASDNLQENRGPGVRS